MRKPSSVLLAALAVVLAALTPAQAADPLALHPKNPRYLTFRGKATILVGSGEHYGAVVNRDFDYRRYLDTLAADGLDLTRLFVGTYYEKPGDFGIEANTLAPAPGRALVPWARSETPGAADGGAKFDLARWDPAYFERLRSFVAEAGKRGIVVEVVLFSSLLRVGLAVLADARGQQRERRRRRAEGEGPARSTTATSSPSRRGSSGRSSRSSRTSTTSTTRSRTSPGPTTREPPTW